ncbi:hypothetical protein FHS18_000573 [Paenibacillus phyllosphaerae]|uniref:Copper amine oxidase-like N-terminal domain-containing protein n=1 Tax=Paenibacillus phyllosphaerae TaxID=274593 RepID=A0A7W5ATL8_9BACL|nr:copper amine oxidase N-terminal domain-containing protein [Paenibacillus phyllosphaerae]MBB3108545.1 hypothetical protein [Paenibacillus phyllosphaerae]
MKRFGPSRKFVIAIMLVVVSSLLFASVSMAAPVAPLKPIKVYLEKEELKFDGEPIAVKNVVYVDFRPILEALGFTITYDNATKKITGKSAKHQLELVVGSSEATLDGKSYTIPHKPFVQNNRLVVPIRFVGEASGLKVTWDQVARTIVLTHIETQKEEAVPPTAEELINIFKKQKELTSAGDLKGFLATFSADSPVLAYYGKQEKMLAELTKTATTFSDFVVKPGADGKFDVTFKTTTKKDGEGFYLESTQWVEASVVKGTDGKWKVYDIDTVKTTYNKPWDSLSSEASVPSADKDAIKAVIDANEKALNEENLDAVIATLDAETGLVPGLSADLKADFAAYDVKVTNEVERIVYFKDSLAYVYVVQKNELVKGTGFTSHKTYKVFAVRKNADGKWVINPSSQLVYYQKL